MKNRIFFLLRLCVFLIPFIVESAIRIFLILPFQWFFTGNLSVTDNNYFGNLIYNIKNN